MSELEPDPMRPTQSTTAGIVLAAGSSTRFGATKQLLWLRGRPLVAHATEHLLAAQIDRILVVVGRDAEAVTQAAGPRAIPVWNPDYRLGQSTSVKAGLQAARALDPAVDAVVIVLADQPDLSSEVVRRVLSEALRTGRPSRARYIDAAGPPVALPRRCWREVITRLQGDVGIGPSLVGLGVVDVDVETSMPPDIDRVSDLQGR